MAEGIKEINGFAGYGVDVFGNVYTKKIVGAHGKIGDKYHILKSGLQGSGRSRSKKYHGVVLCKNGKTFTKLVHNLVLVAFVGEKPNKDYECRHLDGNPHNNNLINLKWGSKKENSGDRVKHGTDCIGVKNPSAKLTEKQVCEIKHLLNDGVKICDIVKLYPIGRSSVSRIKHCKNWKYTLSKQLQSS